MEGLIVFSKAFFTEFLENRCKRDADKLLCKACVNGA